MSVCSWLILFWDIITWILTIDVINVAIPTTIETNIDKESLEVEVILRDEVDLLILKDNKLFRVKSDYVGRVVDNKKIIERNK